jgi:hypothetical protein
MVIGPIYFPMRINATPLFRVLDNNAAPLREAMSFKPVTFRGSMSKRMRPQPRPCGPDGPCGKYVNLLA